MRKNKKIKLRALRTVQRKNTSVYAFFIPGELITTIADISRIDRDNNDSLHGFQRKEIQRHVNNIADYIDQGDILFPNAIILAISPSVKFIQSRGTDVKGTLQSGQIGTLEIPLLDEGKRSAWIVDGQQRSLALAKAKNSDLNVPVVAFVAENLEVQREQFILVNKAKPLPSRLINELLPEVDTHLPIDLATRKIPSELCALLNRDPKSPFYQLIKRVSDDNNKKAIINDSAIIEMIKNSIRNPLGSLAQYKSFGDEPADVENMYKILMVYWSAVKKVFPNAWGLPPTKSRLMHSAGLHSMGVLMDKIVNRASTKNDPVKHIHETLEKIAPHCRWTEGKWEKIDMHWNDIQKIGKHLRLLSDLLNHIDYETSLEK